MLWTWLQGNCSLCGTGWLLKKIRLLSPSSGLRNQNLWVKDQESLKFQNHCLGLWMGIWPCFTLPDSDCVLELVSVFHGFFWPLPPCTLTAIISHCQPTLRHKFLLFYLLAPVLWFPNSFLLVLAHSSWKLSLRQMPMYSTYYQSYSEGPEGNGLDSNAGPTSCPLHPHRHHPGWPESLPRFPMLPRQPFPNHQNNATFRQLLPHI